MADSKDHGVATQTTGYRRGSAKDIEEKQRAGKGADIDLPTYDHDAERHGSEAVNSSGLHDNTHRKLKARHIQLIGFVESSFWAGLIRKSELTREGQYRRHHWHGIVRPDRTRLAQWRTGQSFHRFHVVVFRHPGRDAVYGRDGNLFAHIVAVHSPCRTLRIRSIWICCEYL